MDLRQMRYLLAIQEEGGIRRAARASYVAQPAMSRAIRQLEQELGVDLLNRSAAGVELTDAGVEFAAHAAGVLRSVEDARAAMTEHARLAGTLRVGAGRLTAGELTDPIVDRYRAAHPAVAVAVSPTSFRDQTAGLRSGALDVAIVRGPLEHPDLDVVPIASEPRALLVGREHELAGEHVVDVRDVLDATTVPLDAPDHWATFWQLDALRGRANRRTDLPPVRTLHGLRRGVMNGRTVITVPGAMRRLEPRPTTRCLALHGAEPSPIAVARRRRDRRTQVMAFVEQAADTARREIALLPGGSAP
jgi:DNA-binding transcriptional LysR family regulator